MTERVFCHVFIYLLSDKSTLFVSDTLGYNDHTLAVVFFHLLIYVCKELVSRERYFRQINEVRSQALVASKSRCSRQPTCVTTHCLNDGDHRSVVYGCVKFQFHSGRSYVLCSRAVTRAVICAKKVVVYRLWHAHYAALPTRLVHILADLVAGVHRIVAAVVEEITDIILLKYFQKSLIIRLVNFFWFELVSYATQSRRRSIFEQHKFAHILFANVVKLFIEYALDTVSGTVYRGNAILLQCLGKYARCA